MEFSKDKFRNWRGMIIIGCTRSFVELPYFSPEKMETKEHPVS
jgi:hypothetical protein